MPSATPRLAAPASSATRTTTAKTATTKTIWRPRLQVGAGERPSAACPAPASARRRAPGSAAGCAPAASGAARPLARRLRLPPALASPAHARAFKRLDQRGHVGRRVLRRQQALGLAPATQGSQRALAVLGRELPERRRPACVQPAFDDVECASRCASSASASSGIPLGGGTEDTGITGTSLDPSAASACSRSRWARRAAIAQVGLRHHQHVGHLHDPGLEELEHVAGGGLHHHDDAVADLLDVGLRLAHADRLDHHDVERGREGVGGLARGDRQPAEPAARGGGADQDAVVARIVLDPGAVAEQGAAGALRGGVDGQDRDGPPALAPLRDERGQQRRLAGPGRPGHPDQVRRRLAAELGRRHLREERRGGLPVRRGSRSR